MRFCLACIFLLVIIVHAGASVQIREFCPDPWLPNDADEFIVLSGPAPLTELPLRETMADSDFLPGQKLMVRLSLPGMVYPMKKVMAVTPILNGLIIRPMSGML